MSLFLAVTSTSFVLPEEVKDSPSIAESVLAAVGDVRDCSGSEVEEAYQSLCLSFHGTRAEFAKAWITALRQTPASRALEPKTKWENGPEKRYSYRDYEADGAWLRVIYLAARADPPVGFVTVQHTRQFEASDGVLLAGVGGVSKPRAISRESVDYPELARVARIQGQVVLQITIRTDGTVSDPVVLVALPPHLGLEEAAVQSVKQWRYEPATSDGEPVDVYSTVTVDFAF